MPAGAPSDRHRGSRAGAWRPWAPARPGRGCARARPRVAGNQRTSAAPRGGVGCCGPRARAHGCGRRSCGCADGRARASARCHCARTSACRRLQVVAISRERVRGQAPLAWPGSARIARATAGPRVARWALPWRLGSRERVGDELAHARQEFDAHARMEAIAIDAAQREQTRRGRAADRDQGHRADVGRLAPNRNSRWLSRI